MKKAFKFFDIDGDGAISKDDMKEAMMKLGKKLTDKDICEIFEEADDDGDGLVVYDEFVKNVIGKVDDIIPITPIHFCYSQCPYHHSTQNKTGNGESNKFKGSGEQQYPNR